MSIPTAGTVGTDQVGACQFALGGNQTVAGSTPTPFTYYAYNYTECDSATYITYGNVNYPEGCIFSFTTPRLLYSISDPAIDETASHIRRAQNQPETTYPMVSGKTIPGGLPADGAKADEDLNRLYFDTARRDRNRSKSVATCNANYPNYAAAGKDCDEYPFSSTYQGADSSTRYSAFPVGLSDNRSAGARLGNYYSFDRVRDGRRFRVRIGA